MVEKFEVVEVPAGAHRQDETLGTKFKFWYFEDDQKILFKRGRPNEDWSEKVAAEIAHRIGIPAAKVDLATLDGDVGIISPSFLEPGAQLFHGNELLMVRDDAYPVYERYHVGRHTLAAVFAALTSPPSEPAPIEGAPDGWDACDQMVGYLMLDALIGNTDRHHENWAIYTQDNRRHLAPTYDHASSLGRNEQPRKMELCLSERDPRVTMGTWVNRARSAFYAEPAAKKPLTTLAAFEDAACRRPAAARYWYGRLTAVDPEELQILFERLPDDRITALHRQFAVRIVEANAARIAGVVSELA